MDKIRTENISISLAKQDILKDVSIKLEKGKRVGLIGPNGSGKSTLLKIIYRALEADHGMVYLNGKDIEEFSYKESARQMAVVSQINEINFDFTVMEVVLLGRSPYKKLLEGDNEKDYKLARSALEIVGMDDYVDRSFTSLSGGEKQRVILARALAQDTKCMVLDEPTNHLDVRHQLSILRTIKDLGISCLTALHDLNMAAQFCDYIYALKDGKLYGQGSPRELLSEDFIKEVYQVQAQVIDIEGRLAVLYSL